MYSKLHHGKYKYLLYSRVICGDSCVGKSSMITPPCKRFTNIKHESLVDKLNNPKVFVTTVDNQAYPVVLIRLTLINNDQNNQW